MRERRDIVDLWREGQPSVLATLIAVEGSSYRRTGARLLIAQDGRYAGAISGGCLEAELMRKARWSVRNGATVQRFTTLFDDTSDIPYGLGCGGIVDVLLEPSGTPAFDALMRSLDASLAGTAQYVRTFLPEAGISLRRVTSCAPLPDHALVQGTVLNEILVPPQRLVICGAGDDARPVSEIAALLGWDVTVVDGRVQWARVERFPNARHVMVAQNTADVPLRAEDAVIIMTHSYEQDREWLIASLRADVRYLGLLGSRHRSALLVKEAAVMLGWTVERVCEKVFAPVGLDLGGDGAEAIALAIVAEVHARCEGKLGASQRMTPELVAEQIAKGGASRYLQAQCAL